MAQNPQMYMVAIALAGAAIQRTSSQSSTCPRPYRQLPIAHRRSRVTVNFAPPAASGIFHSQQDHPLVSSSDHG
jgi:hypothetical protein